jgi:hypothetical protein
VSGILNVLLSGGGLVNITDLTPPAPYPQGQNLSGIGGTSVAKYRLKADGIAQRTTPAAGAYVDIPGQWLKSGAASSYEAQGTFTNNTGGTAAGPTTWTSLSATQEWTFTTTNNDATVDLTVEIRLASGGAAIATALIFMEALSAP